MPGDESAASSGRKPPIIFDKFDPDEEEFEYYKDRLEQYLLVSGIDRK